MADEKVKFKFDLDAKEALSRLTEIKEGIEKIGESKSVDGLIAGFGMMVPQLMIATTAIMAVREALNLTIQGEELERINNQFDVMAEQAGLSANAIKEGLEKSLGGVVDFDDALKASSAAFLKLNGNAAKIPELFEMARKTADIFGGDVINNFEAISQAIASGNLRALKHLGIIVDADKSYRDYAKTLGTTSNALSETEKQTALLNSVLGFNKEKLSLLQVPTSSVTEALQKLRVTFKDFADSIAEWVAKSGAVNWVLDQLAAGFKIAGDAIKDNFGTNAEKAKARLLELTQELAELKLTLAQRGTEDQSWLDKMFGAPTKIFEDRIAAIRKEMAALQSQTKEAPKAEEHEEVVKAKPIDLESQRLRLEQKNKFERELLQITASRIKSQMEIETDYANYQKLLDEQRLEIVQQFDAKERELALKGAEGKELTAQQANQMIEQLELEKNAKLHAFDIERQNHVMQVYENQVKAAQNAADGIKAAFNKSGMEAQKNLQDFGKMGQTVFTAVSGGAARFFKGLGEGSKDAGSLMREFMFGAIADIAEAQGQELLAFGIGTMNGVAIAEGGALMALSGFLRSQAGGGGGIGGGGSSSGGSSSGGSMGPTTALAPTPTQAPQKQVTVNFLGDYLQTEQTQKRLVELIRQETDATSFKYEQIGVR